MRIKLYFIPILILLFTVNNLRSQTYILTPPGGSVFTTCKGFVQNDLCCYDFPFCTVNYYCQGDNHFNTFQSGTPGMPIRMNFTYLDLNTGDFVRVYQGVGTGGPLLATFTNTYTSLGTAVTSTTGVITILFTTNLDNNVGDGYNAIVGCPPVGCSGNLPAGDNCASTTRICDTDPYCGNTGGWYTADNENIAATNAEFNNFPNTFATNNTFCGSIENNSWLVFTANTATPTFSVNVSNCASSSSGIQMLLLASTNCNTFSAVSNCISQNAGPASFTLGATTALTPGTDYYIMIDGFAGNYCDYTVTPMNGVQIATLTAGTSALCQNQTAVLTTSNTVAGSTFSWVASTPGAIGGSNTTLSITATPTVVGTTVYTVNITQPNGCAIQSYTRQITLNPLPFANAGTSPASITCASPTQVLSGSGGGTYVWSGTGIVSGGGTANPTVNQVGPYSLVVTSGAGCTSTNVATVSVPVNTVLPVPAISSPTVLNCSNPSMNLTGSPASNVNYSWTGPGIVSGGTTATPLINAGGTYNLNVTSTINGCSSATSIAIAAPNTSIVVAPSTTGSVTCGNLAINLSTPLQAGHNYTWTAPGGASITGGVNSAATTGSNSGTYSVTVFNTTNGCSQVGTIAANINTVAPIANASNSGVVTCTSTALNLSSTSTGVNYNWVAPVGSSIVSGGTTNNASASGGGTYTLFITSTVNSCTSSALTTANTQTVKPIPSITNNPVITCTTPTVNITGSPASGVTYTWSGGTIVGPTNNNNANVSSATVYSLAVTSTSNGCTSTTAATVNITSNLTTPAITAIGSQTANSGCGTSSIVVLSGTATPAGSTYTWASSGGFSSGVNNSTVAVNGATTYTLNSTHPVTGCIASLVYTVSPSVNQPTVIASSSNGTLTCANTIQSTTVTSNPSTGVTYAWSGPGIVGPSNTAAVSGSLAGVYNLTVTNTSNNCNTTLSYNLAVNNTPITPNAVATNTINCNNTTATISAAPTPTAAAFNYTWSAGPNTSSIVVNPTVNTSYTVTVQNPANGCTGTAVYNVIANTVPPTAIINTTPVITCNSPTVNIAGGPVAGVTYTWSGGTISGSANNANVNVSSAAIYSLAVTSTSNGCTSTPAATINITSNLTTPVITALGSQTASSGCGTSSIVILGGTATPAGSTYTWASSGGFSSGVNNSTVAVNGATTYTLNSTHPLTGCISSLVYTVSPSANQPTVTAASSTGTVTCSNPIQSTTVTSNPSTGVTYAWSGPGIVGPSNTAAVSGSLAGVYNLTVTNTSNNCNTTLSYNLAVNNTPITPNAVATNTINCNNTTATISTAPTPTATAFNYTWSAGPNTSSIVVNPTVNTSYTVTVQNPANGCTGTAVYNVIANTVPPTAVNVSPNNVLLACPAQTTFITGSATGAVSYSWVAPAGGSILSGANTATAQVTSSSIGTFSLIATAANGCSSAAATATVSPNTNAPTFSLSNANPSITCLTSSPNVTVALTSTVAIQGYTWSPVGGIAGTNTTAVVSFSAPGIYTVVIEATNGCLSTGTVSVGNATISPSVVAGTGTAQTISCTNTIVTIAPTFTPSANLTYTWSGPGIVGSANNASVQVNQNGSYSLTVTNSLTGCSSTSITIPVVGTNIPPSLNVSSSSSIGIGCQPNTSTVTLTASSAGSVTYSWSTGATSSNINTSNAGTYSVTVTDNNSGCSVTQTIAVANNTITPSFTASASGNLPCGGAGTTTLNAQGTNTNVIYNWSGPSITNGSNTANPVVNGAGVYTVVVSDNVTGCASTQTVSVTSTSVIAAFNPDVTSGLSPLTVNFSNQSVGATTYSWSFGNGTSTQTNPTNVFPTGTYTVVLTSINGACTSTAEIVIKVSNKIGSVPEVFTPNGDGHNDVFEIIGLDSYPSNSLQIFNRWGNQVYFAKPYKNDWDGSPNANGKTGSNKLPTATYFYILDLGDQDQTIIRGFIQLQY